MSGFGNRRKLIILTYHRVIEKRDEFVRDITADIFAQHVDVLSRNFNVLRLDDAVGLMAARRLPSRAVCITFDDGYADNFEVALPILKAHNVAATFFVATGYLDGGAMWNDVIRQACQRSSDEAFTAYLQRRGRNVADDLSSERLTMMREMIGLLKYSRPEVRAQEAQAFIEEVGVTPSKDLMMSSTQVSELADEGMEIGAHTVNHPILNSVSLREARREVEQSRETLEALTGRIVSSFAFPNGRPRTDYNSAHVGVLEELGFRAAVTTRPACARYRHSPLELPRLGIWDSTPSKILLRLLDHYARR